MNLRAENTWERLTGAMYQSVYQFAGLSGAMHQRGGSQEANGTCVNVGTVATQGTPRRGDGSCSLLASYRLMLGACRG